MIQKRLNSQELKNVVKTVSRNWLEIYLVDLDQAFKDHLREYCRVKRELARTQMIAFGVLCLLLITWLVILINL